MCYSTYRRNLWGSVNDIKKAKSYLNNKDLRREILQYHDSKIDSEGVISENLHMMFYQLSVKIAKKACWNKYQFTEDMIQSGYLKCISIIHKFDTTRENPFAYFTTVVHNIFIDTIKKENRQKEIRHILVENHKIEFGMPLDDSVIDENE